MAIGTYAQLQTAVASWLARDDLTAQIPDFIALCEAKLNRDLRCNQMEKRATALVNTASDEPEFIALPLDFQTMRRVRLNGVTGKPRLQFMAGAQADEYRTSLGDVAGRPQKFTIFGDEMELIPTPDDAYTLEMVYRASIPALSDSDTTNWLLTFAPDIYLYGALLESAPYLKEDSRIQTWAAGFSYALDSLNKLAMDQTFNAGPLVMTTSGATP